MLAHPAVTQILLFIRHVLYGDRKVAIRKQYKLRESETIRYVVVMSFCPYICKYFKFPVGHPVIHVGDACKKRKPACLWVDS